MNLNTKHFNREGLLKPVGLFINNSQKNLTNQTINSKTIQQIPDYYIQEKSNVCAVKNLKKNLDTSNISVSGSAFSIINSSCQVLDAVKAFKNLSISNSGLNSISTSCKSIVGDRSTPSSTSTLPNSYISLQKSSQRLSIDSTKSISSGFSAWNFDLPDGAEASDIKGMRAFEDLSETSEKSSKSILSSLNARVGASTHLRKDVVWKGLLRNMKKYYSSQFKNYFNYSDQKFIKKSDCKQVALKKVKEFSDEIFSEESAGDIGQFILALLDPKQKLYSEESTFPQLSEKIADLLRSFTSRKLRDLLRLHQFAKLVLHFLNSNEELIDLVKRPQDNSDNIYLYRGYISSLTALAEKSIN